MHEIREHSDPKQSSSGRRYETIAHRDGQLACNCQGWATKKLNKARTCKHIDKLLLKHGLASVDKGDFRFVKMGALGSPALRHDWPTGPVASRTAFDRADAADAAAFAAARMSDVPLVPQTKFTTIPEVDAYPAKKRFNIIPELDEDADTAVFVAPMLASQMPDVQDQKIETLLAALPRYNSREWAMEEKFDGHRVVVTVNAGRRVIVTVNAGTVKAWSRPGVGKDALVRELPDHLTAQFAALPTGTYDGELLIPGGRSYNVTDGRFAGQEIFVVFDIMSLLGLSTVHESYDARRAYLTEIFPDSNTPKSVRLAQSFAPSAAAVKAIWARDGEGAILKRRAATYRPGVRSLDFIKLKGLIPTLMTVTGYKSGKNGPYSTVLLRDASGRQTKVKTLDADALRAFALAPETFIGRKLWIESQPNGSEGYRHPRWDRWASE